MFDTEQLPQEEQIIEQEQPVEQPVEQVTPQQETPAERNFRALVEKNKRLERERDEAIRVLQEKQTPQVAQIEEDEEINIGLDDIAEGKHIKGISREIKKLREELKSYKQSSAVMSEEAILKSQYPDIDKVVNKETLAALRDADPDFAEMLDTSTSFRAKAISAYKHIKKMGIYVEDTFQNDRELAQRNAAKPKPLASVSPQQGDSPLSRANAFANGLTPELKTQLRKEMEEARKNR